MEEQTQKGKSNFSEYYVTEEFKNILKQAFQYKKLAKKAYLFVLLIAIGVAVILGVIANGIWGNIAGFIVGRNNRFNSRINNI